MHATTSTVVCVIICDVSHSSSHDLCHDSFHDAWHIPWLVQWYMMLATTHAKTCATTMACVMTCGWYYDTCLWPIPWCTRSVMIHDMICATTTAMMRCVSSPMPWVMPPLISWLLLQLVPCIWPWCVMLATTLAMTCANVLCHDAAHAKSCATTTIGLIHTMTHYDMYHGTWQDMWHNTCHGMANSWASMSMPLATMLCI